jgi:N-acetylneuraminic acid mutarotase
MKKLILFVVVFICLQFNTLAQWTRHSDMPTARWGLSACMLDGKIYALGGSQNLTSPGYATNKMEVYDPVLDTWDTTKASMLTSRVMFMTAVVSGKIYAIGGRQVWVTGDDLGTVEEYDPLTNTWAIKSPMQKPRTNAGVCVHDNKIYIVGGIKGGAAWQFSNDLQIYDPVTDTWDTSKTAMTYPRDPYVCTLNNFIYSVGGTNGSPYAGLHTVEAYDLVTDSWTEKAYTNHGRKGSSVDMLNGKIYASGGEDIADSVKSVEVYDPTSDKWTIIGVTPIWYTMHASTVVLDKIYLLGGSIIGGRYDVFLPTSIMYSFDPDFAYATSLEISHLYFPPTGDTLIVNTNLQNQDFHSTDVYSYIQGNGFSFQDSIKLFDDGLHHDGAANDNFYGGTKWLSGLNEDFFEVELKTIDLTKSTINWYSFSEKFTTAGPLKVDSIVSDSISNYRYSIKPYIRNNGTQTQIENITIRLICDDPWATTVYPYQRPCPDIAPGQIVGLSQLFAVAYDSATFPGYFNLRFEISSSGIPYWLDSIETIVTRIKDELPIPLVFYLTQNYPNPFNPSTTIKYQLPHRSNVSLKIYDIIGNEIAELVNEEQEVGYYNAEFNAAKLSSGVYFYRLKAGSYVETKKMILLK